MPQAVKGSASQYSVGQHRPYLKRLLIVCVLRHAVFLLTVMLRTGSKKPVVGPGVMAQDHG